VDAAWVGAGAAVATALIYVVLGFIAVGQVKEAQRLREQQSRPYVIVDFEFERWLVYLVIRNIGRTPARNIRVAFDRKLETTLTKRRDINEAAAFSRPISMLAPERAIRIRFDSVPQRLEKKLPLVYGVDVSYQDERGQTYSDPTFTLDLSTYEDAAVDPKGLPELVSEMESIQREISKWTDGSRGLLAFSVNRRAHVRRTDRPYLRDEGARVRKDLGWRAYIAWFSDRMLTRYGWR
jgi:hypothetical protein